MASVQPDFSPTNEKMPVIFVGHGSPMNAVEDNEFSRAWADAGRALPRPQAILVVSAHWQTRGTQVTAMPAPKTIHDFYGFPPELYQQQYPAPGSAELAKRVQEITPAPVAADMGWGLDHGAWSVLLRMFPGADIPVVQLSLDRTQPPAYHYQLGRALRSLRDRGVLVIGSGNMVHNLGIMCWEDRAYDWATEFDATLEKLMLAGDHEAIIDYERWGRSAALSIPTNEHFLPLLYVLGMQEPGEPVSFFAHRVTYCAISMRSVRIG